MRNVHTPPRRKSVINLFSTPPLRRSLLSGSPRGPLANSPSRNQSTQQSGPYATDSDDSDEDDNTLTATGDISMSHPYYVPGVAGALSPQPRSRRATPTLKANLLWGPLHRPRPPVRRLTSAGAATYKSLTVRPGPPSNMATPSRLPTNPSPNLVETPFTVGTPPYSGNTSVSSCNSSIGSIPDEDIKMSTKQSRFIAFMQSRDLTKSPQKKANATESVDNRNRRLDGLAREAANAIGREVARPASRPLRGNARLPPRPPIPDWGAMDADI
ncbi:hypothetical protein DFH07DRAFT_828128 [Mycena maculata]|uniref:Uncharacterized protein n=1 Tax=Mycena maculata TaxID=230809 RepID=A0AAD7IV51_9AGAR|nr:hypothetical protein DFH07DRAFT_828128 [Mycena maculata]